MEKLMFQCKIQSENATMITWLSDDKPFKVGDFITLKDTDEPSRKWKVITKGEGHPKKDVKETWHSQDLKRDGNRAKLNLS